MNLIIVCNTWKIWIGDEIYLSAWCRDFSLYQTMHQKKVDYRLKRWITKKYHVPFEIFNSKECGYVYENPGGIKYDGN